jgi:hypothetical protein
MIRMNADGRILAAADADKANSFEVGDFGRETGAAQVVNL